MRNQFVVHSSDGIYSWDVIERSAHRTAFGEEGGVRVQRNRYALSADIVCSFDGMLVFALRNCVTARSPSCIVADDTAIR
jgi:hypothetical protein